MLSQLFTMLLRWRFLIFFYLMCGPVEAEEFLCGTAVVNVSPQQFPVIRNGGFLQAEDHQLLDPLHARCLVLQGGEQRIAIVVVDSCMLPLSVCDEAKKIASQATGIPVDRMLISATHTHSAPSVMDYCLGSGADARYREFLPGQIAAAIQRADAGCRPARAGWARVDASAFTKCRRWITRSDQWQLDPFGEQTVHANMHPGHQNANYIGPSGPVDPWLSVLMVTDDQGTPMAALANFSMHYFGGHAGTSADYYGRFASMLQQQFGAQNAQFVGIMSQGTSGDLWWGDYSKSKSDKPFQHMEAFAEGLVGLTMKAIEGIEYRSDVGVRMAERRLTMQRRLPDAKRLAWARRLNQLRGDRLPNSRPEVYAMQAAYLHEHPTEEVVLQAIRIGDLAITGMPNEVYGLTGLKLKRQSPLSARPGGMTFNMSLANGACGYIPPPEQHALGGYTTWPATTAGLEVAAEPKIVGTLLDLLESVSGEQRQEYHETATPYAERITAANPDAFWRLAELESGALADATGHNRALRVDGLVAYHLPGVTGRRWGSFHESHAIQLAGGKLVAADMQLGESYSVQMSLWLGTPDDVRGTTAVLFALGSDKLQITGQDHDAPGRLMFGDHVGERRLASQAWHHITFVRNGDFVEIFIGGDETPELSFKTARYQPAATFYLGGDAENTANLEGKLDEVSVFDRALTTEEVRGFFRDDDAGSPPSQPRDADASLQCIHIRDGFVVELVASEPLVQDPVAIDWGADGKLWVAEMADYPSGMDGKGAPGGRIRYLEDTNQDGKYDSATLFLDGVGFPNGVMAWRDGVLVTAAPEIFYAEDTNGDGNADHKEPLLTGFLQGNQQLRVNGLRWGLDNLVHCASGAHHSGFGSQNVITSTKRAESIGVGSRDFRFDPDTGFLDPQSGPSQYGRVRNDVDDWFGVQNSWPLWHYVLQDHYLRRNRDVASVDPRQQVRQPRMPEVYSAKPPQRRFHGFDHAGHYTSACGISIYRDDLLFPRSELHAFTCAPFHNLVQHHVLQADGVSYLGERADDGPIDFFASTDRWTRPVMTRTGPDGALWIVDMYRYMIEHPEWLPSEGQETLRPHYRAGEQLGRIYRVLPQARALREVELPNHNGNLMHSVSLLSHPNGIVRDLAHRELWQSAEDLPVDAIRKIVTDHDELTAARLQALSLLAGKHCCDVDLLQVALDDPDPYLRRLAIRIAETLDSDEILPLVGKLIQDSDPRVRLQLASSLGNWQDPEAGRLLAVVARRGDLDAYTRAAIVSSLPVHFEVFVAAVLADLDHVSDPLVQAMLHLGEKQPQQLTDLVLHLSSDDGIPAGLPNAPHVSAVVDRRIARLVGWLDSLEARNLRLDDWGPAAKAIEALTERQRVALQSTRDYRPAPVGLLGRDARKREQDLQLLAAGLSNQQSHQVQAAILERLARTGGESVADLLVDRCSELLPEQRGAVIRILLGRWQWQTKLLQGIEAGTVRSEELSLAQRNQLLSSDQEVVATRAAQVFGASDETPRQAIVARYRDEIRLGDRSRGLQVFQQNCEVCHTLDRKKSLVGPDLRSVTGRSRVALLEAILDPSVQIEPKYTNYTFALKDGRTVLGIVEHEDAASLTVRTAEGHQQTLLRTSIELTQRTPNSLMPEGFELKIDPQQMADLVVFLQSL